ncbi:DUF3592 domain-containing protein [Dyella choica]|uniref:DUF3592 domain-containing protein n=1 Tax=Dyella choica TaxID=1927959 RepID=A0A3S0PI20_9GAMM|nr:DUF3592 domain-containing protein [Dyella choica]RUL74560.1 DUF3592 domain-containing protein [Dyella choica]
MNILFPSLFSLVFIFIGVGIISFGKNTAAKAKQSLSWPSTEGEIAHSAVLYQTDTSNDQGDAFDTQTDTSNTIRATSTYKADIVYRYKVRGKSYSSSKISFMDFASTNNRAQSVVNRYPDNSTVQVYYNPANPADAVLEPGDASGITLLYAIGSLFAVAGLFFLLMSLTGHVHVH